MQNLSNQQKRFLKSKAHNLNPVVIVAGNGLSENVIAAIEEALEIHELIKVKLKADSKEQKDILVEAICEQTGGTKIQLIGHVLILFRPSKKATIILPKA